MSNNNISVFGSVNIEFDLDVCSRVGDVITSTDTYDFSKFKYAVSNNDFRLQRFMNEKSFADTKIVTTTPTFKKYFFFPEIDFLPDLAYISANSIDIDSCSDQLLALLLAIWTEKKHVFLFGYDIEDLTEREILWEVGKFYPHTNIVYVRKPNINKISLFDSYPNMSVMDYNEFKVFANEKV